MQAKTCPTCGRSVLEANQDSGLPVVLDPKPLSREGEAFALMAGRRTYAIRFGGALMVYRRNHFQIKGRPAGTERFVDIVVEHDCHGEPLPHIKPRWNRPQTNMTDLIDPPF